MDRAFGIDVSRYQGQTKWDVVKAHTNPKVIFAGIRATVSWGYRDSWFAHNWAEAKRVGILRMAYHVVYPGENVKAQVDNFLATVGSDYGELPLVLDCELDHGHSASKISENILSHALMIEDRTGRKPIIYSRKSWVDVYMAGATWLDNYDWWLAIYLSSGAEHQGPPPLPKGVSKWLIHQTASHGAPIGVESLQLDYDRWNGIDADVYKYAGIKQGPTWAQSIDEWARTQGYSGPKPEGE